MIHNQGALHCLHDSVAALSDLLSAVSPPAPHCALACGSHVQQGLRAEPLPACHVPTSSFRKEP